MTQDIFCRLSAGRGVNWPAADFLSPFIATTAQNVVHVAAGGRRTESDLSARGDKHLACRQLCHESPSTFDFCLIPTACLCCLFCLVHSTVDSWRMENVFLVKKETLFLLICVKRAQFNFFNMGTLLLKQLAVNVLHSFYSVPLRSFSLPSYQEMWNYDIKSLWNEKKTLGLAVLQIRGLPILAGVSLKTDS